MKLEGEGNTNKVLTWTNGLTTNKQVGTVH